MAGLQRHQNENEGMLKNMHKFTLVLSNNIESHLKK